MFFIFIVFFSHSLFAEDHDNSVTPISYHSISISPMTIISTALLVQGIESIWFIADVNWRLANQEELGTGVVLRRDRASLVTRYRSYNNKERQSGLFWGVYGLAEWRMMHWFYDEHSNLKIASSTTSGESQEHIYHSIGITMGAEAGFRVRINNFNGISAFIGMGVPLFYCFGDTPQDVMQGFYLQNMLLRTLNVGLLTRQ
jgi:hypothetical protein